MKSKRVVSLNFVALFLAVGTWAALPQSAHALPRTLKGQPITEFLSTGGLAARRAMQGGKGPRAAAPLVADPGDGLIPPELLGVDQVYPDPGTGNGVRGEGSRFRNVFVSDPCSDPPPPRFDRTVQSETEIAVLNHVNGATDDGEDPEDNGSSGRLMVAGFNDSEGFYDNTRGLSGFSYSTNGGQSWIDGGGLPPLVPGAVKGADQYFGDPVVVVHHRSKNFYYASIYSLPDGTFSLSVNRGKFRVAPPQGVESKANTRCEGNPAKFGIPDPPAYIRERIIWDPPVVAVPVVDPADFIDKEWLYVDQRTGELYLAYVRFGADGSTPLELVRSKDEGKTWIGPTVIVPNLDDTFNTGVQPITTPTGRVIVTWFARTFALIPGFPEVSQRIEAAYSDDDGVTFGPPVRVTSVNPQGEPKGYNRRRPTILNAPYIMVDKARNDGEESDDKKSQPGYGNVYITYFDGKGPLGAVKKAADIKLSVSTDNGATYHPPVKVNDDKTETTHVFPSVQVNRRGTVFVTWIDRRVDPQNNILNDTWAAFSNHRGRSFGHNLRVTDVSTDWFARADARPNFGDYNSSEVIDFDQFASIWSDARFPGGTFIFIPSTCDPAPPPGAKCPPVTRRAATPDTLFSNVGDGAGEDGNGDGGKGGEGD